MMDIKKITLIIALAFLIVLLVVSYFLIYKAEKKEVVVVSPPPKEQAIQPKTPEVVFPTYSYDAEKLRDPFASLVIKTEERKKGGSPLESYDIDELTLTGVAWDKKGSYALIQAPDGRFYVARENDRIGFTGGRIVKIKKDAIEIKEGDRKTKYLKLRLDEK